MTCDFVIQLSRLRRLSAESVENTDCFDPFKEYLHVVRPVEVELRKLLRDANVNQNKCLVLLCGSAGDGKSHLISYLKNSDPERLLEDYEPYNDATKVLEYMTLIKTRSFLQVVRQKVIILFCKGLRTMQRKATKSILLRPLLNISQY